jgi:23S rRNA G2069 N7-methylase RlmK/C1962 C5-methylase RlmI
VKLIQMTPRVARAIYESEASDLGLLRHSSGFSPALRKMEQEFERIRYDAQEQRVRSLFDAGKAHRRLSLEEARRILWMYTSRDVYRMLVHEAGWTPDRYETWLSTTLLEALVDSPRYRALTGIRACFSAQSSAKSAICSHPFCAGRRCANPSYSFTSVSVFFDL